MRLLKPKQLSAAASLYGQSSEFFPIIGAVLNGQQDGWVYADDAASPRSVYVEHKFGFSQFFGNMETYGERFLFDRFIINKDFYAPKIRLYGATVPAWLDEDAYRQFRSERQRFKLGHKTDIDPASDDRVEVRALNSADIVLVEKLGILSRFWQSDQEFVDNANAFVAMVEGELAAICYAAAISNGAAEIDVMTLDTFRNRGFAKMVVSAFVKRCAILDIEPLWDCFTNNSGSVNTATACGFVNSSSPYPFFTIGR